MARTTTSNLRDRHPTRAPHSSWAPVAALISLFLAALVVAVAVGLDVDAAAAIVAFALAAAFVEWLIAPGFVQWVIPAHVIAHDGTRYDTEDPIGEIVAHRCRDASVPLVRLGVVDDGTPNAFTFGRTRRDARVFVTRGLLERLDDAELDAVIAHEIGHIRNRDFVLMTLACAIPLALFMLGRACIDADDGDDDEGGLAIVGLALLVCYLASEFLVLWLSRTRELAADHWSCRSTQNGDALVSALVKISYGLTVDRVEGTGSITTERGTKAERKAARKADARNERRTQLASMLGIVGGGPAPAMASGFVNGLDAERAVAALRWEAASPWARVFEKVSTHPLVGRRIAALQASGVPGRPTRLGLEAIAAGVDDVEQRALRMGFVADAAAATGPWITLTISVALLLAAPDSWLGGILMVTAGVLFAVAQMRRYPFAFAPVDDVTALLERTDASPVRGIPVTVRGRVVGRATPGYLLEADLVLEDESGIVALDHRSPIPFGAAIFGFRRAKDFIGRDVTARGWYRRTPGPVIELRELNSVDGSARARPWLWIARFAFAGAVALGGLTATAAHFATVGST